MKTRTMGALGAGLCLTLALTLSAPSPASARGGHGWLWALPIGAAAVAIAGMTYYTHAGVYYRPAPGGYVVVPPPVAVATPVVVPPPVMEPAPPILPPGAAVGAVVVVSPSLNVRSGPGYGYSVVTVVTQGSTLEVIGGGQGWLTVRTPSGDTGWVAQQFTSPAGSGMIPPNG